MSSNSNRLTSPQTQQQYQTQQNINQTCPLSTNRLLIENDTLTYKYNQYRQSLLKPFQSESGHDCPQDLLSSSTSLNLNPNTSSPIKDTPNQISPNDHPLAKSLSSLLLFNSFPEKDNEADSLTQLKREYDNRILSLYNNLRVVVSKIQTDDVISAMQNDANSAEFISSRVKEILDEDFYSEKETFIAKLSEENAELKAQLNIGMLKPLDKKNPQYISKVQTLNVEQELQLKQMHQCLNEHIAQVDSLSKDNQTLHQINADLNETVKRLTFENTRMKSDTSNYVENASSFESEMNQATKGLNDSKREIERLNKVISVIEIDLNSSEDIIKEKTNKNEQLVKEVTSLQNQLFDSNLKLKKAVDEKKSLQSLIDHYEKERKELYAKCSVLNDDMQNSQREKLDMIEKKHKEKLLEVQHKLQSQKEVISALESELALERAKAESVKEQFSKMCKEMQENIKIVSREWEKKLKKEQEDFEHVIQELETKHSIEMSGANRDNALELEAKQKELAKCKQTIELYKNIDKEFMRIDQHEDLMNKAMSEMKRQQENEVNKKSEVIKRDFEEKLKKLAVEKKNEYDFIMQSSYSKQLQLENENSTLKQVNSTLKAQLDSNKKDNSTLSNEIDSKDKMISQLKSSIDSLNNSLKALKDSNESLRVKEDKIEQDNLLMRKNLIAYNGLRDEYERLKCKANEKDQAISQLSKDNQALIAKLNSSDVSHKLIEAKHNELLLQTSEIKTDCESTKRENANYSKRLSSLSFNQRNQNELLLKLLNSKAKALKAELTSIKESSRKELNSLRKDTSVLIQALNDKAYKLLQSNNSLIALNSSLKSKSKEDQYRINELQVENTNLTHLSAKTRLENDSLLSEIDNEKKEKSKLRQRTYETESQEKNSLRETVKKLQSNLSNIILFLVKAKKNYSAQIAKFRYDIEDLRASYCNDLSAREKQIERMAEMQENDKKAYAQLKSDYKANSLNLSTIQANFEQLKEVYENKIKLLTTKVAKTELELSNNKEVSHKDNNANSKQIN